ncbi:tRNA (adenosine(37)-N6)-threonylcarbamoyltransferase complex dimerization subunit type 1 TsaB [Sulfobacillus harzensis]|uniref:tRNA (Adenosine(37)-N6)-threonylcarbamoyltransferase complex dimerization subunit type 1 TsaB n=1 Tax=Sulfobacillus harzensis TaxID=2729629 RepID=A0A7Y0L6J7_9FIRM|nr:tRNA (adenosine(37)-N6)-threonylcarbamoyltransferase complex dimerization subunit type 1 TsaB [Sulfobacillus harzensis]NMP24207.1 tRNA (adenosine(37)-N6)-threonylcarbamoyltransferase complex dimerization subunit type 1 TsaB [Sulfobacillus harzensis]
MGFKVMGIEAAGPVLTVGYIEDGRMVASRSLRRPRQAGSYLADWMADMADELGRPDGLAVGIGPGSFTGVRVAVTAAKAYAFSWQIPVKGVSSLAAWARAVSPGHRVVVTSERRGPAFYLGYYWVGAEGPESIIPDTAISGALPDLFPTSEAVWVLGPLAEDPAALRAIGPHARPAFLDCSGVLVALEGQAALQWGKTDHPAALAPQYLRVPAAAAQRGDTWRS